VINSNDTVPEPVGCGGESNTACANWERKNLSNHHPSSRAPGSSEDSDIEAYER
jgi:hypothetical protein